MPCAKQYVYFSLTDNQIKISLEKQYIKQKIIILHLLKIYL